MNKIALGIYYDGQNLSAVCIEKTGESVSLLFSEIDNLSEINPESSDQTGNPGVLKESLKRKRFITSPDNELGIDSLIHDPLASFFEQESLTAGEELQNDLQKNLLTKEAQAEQESSFLLNRDHRFSKEFINALEKMISKAGKHVKLGFTFAEPGTYHTEFKSSWGLEGNKLKNRILEELVKEDPDSRHLKLENIQVIPNGRGGIVTVVHENASEFQDMLVDYEGKFNRRFPAISFIENCDISLVNLVNFNYELKPQEVTVIVYVGSESSRLIFLAGHEILQISPRLDEGNDSIIIFDSIYNRIIMEQDNLHIPKIHRIITVGDAKDMGVKYYLSRMFPENKQILVDDLKLKNLFVPDRKLYPAEKISQFAIPIGCAWRILDDKHEDAVKIDFLPAKVRERQKTLRLGISGWMILALIFLLTLFFTFKVKSNIQMLKERHQQLEIKILELANLQEIEKQLIKSNEKLDYYKKTYSVLDSMLSRKLDWSGLVQTLSEVASRTGGCWLTEIIPNPGNVVTIKGYTLYRTRIAQFSDAVGKTVLKKVESTEIRNQTVYFFELQASIPEQKPLKSMKDIKPVLAEKAVSENASRIQESPISREQYNVAITSAQIFGEWYEKGRNLFGKYRYQEAIEIFRQLIASNFNSPLLINCHYWIGESFFALHRYQDAIQSFTKVTDAESLKKTAALFMLARSYAAAGQTDEAAGFLDKIMAEYPQDDYASKARALRNRLR